MDAKLVMYTRRGRRKAFALTQPSTVLGRAEDCDLRIPLAAVSRHHCRLTVSDDERLFVRDLDSSNGTYVNNERVEQAELHAGDRLNIGTVIFTLKLNGVPEEPGIDRPEEEALKPGQGEQAEESAFDFEAAIAEERGENQSADERPSGADLSDPLADLEAMVDEESTAGRRRLGPQTG